MDYLLYRKSDGSLRIYLSNGDGTFKPVIQNNPNIDYSNWDLYAGDFNGDGKLDVMWINKNSDTNNVHIYFGQESVDSNNNKIFNFSATPVISTIPKTYNEYWDGYGNTYVLVLGDFNGDGKTDFMWFRWVRNMRDVYLSNGNGTFTAVSTTGDNQTYGVSKPNCCTYDYKFIVGDFNGDGKTDYMWYGLGTTEVYLSNGNGTFADRIEDTSNASINSLWWLTAADLNGDGKSDIVAMEPRYTNEPSQSNTCDRLLGSFTPSYVTKYGYRIFISKGDGTFIPDGDRVEAGTGSWCSGAAFDVATEAPAPATHLADLNGDGIQDVLFSNTEWLEGVKLNMKIVALTKSPNIDQLFNFKSITNGMGGTTSFSYAYSYEHTNFADLPFIFSVVKSITVDDGFGTNPSTVTYNYYNGLYDYSTREFRGFGTVSSINPDNVTTTTTYNQSEYPKGRPNETDQYNPNGTNFSKTVNNWVTVDITGTSAKFAKMTSTRSESYDTQTVFIQKDYTYDDTNGNLLVESSSGTGAENLTTTTEYTNVGTGANAWIWSPTKITGSGSTSGKMRETYFTYYPDGTGNLEYEDKWLNGGTNPRVAYTYDNYGNRKTTTDPKGVVSSSIDYDTATNTYPATVAAAQTGSITHVVNNLTIDYGLG